MPGIYYTTKQIFVFYKYLFVITLFIKYRANVNTLICKMKSETKL